MPHNVTIVTFSNDAKHRISHYWKDGRCYMQCENTKTGYKHKEEYPEAWFDEFSMRETEQWIRKSADSWEKFYALMNKKSENA